LIYKLCDFKKIITNYTSQKITTKAADGHASHALFDTPEGATPVKSAPLLFFAP